MKTKNTLVLLIALALIQYFVPAKMIYDHEIILRKGEYYKFISEPIDPSDPFRGKYMTLDFKERKFRVENTSNWNNNQIIYCQLKNDSAGYAVITDVLTTPPTSGNYFEASVDYVELGDTSYLHLDFPFRKLYVEESKAANTEIEYAKATRDTTSVAYARVAVYNGNAVISNVYINENPIIKK